MSQSSESFFEGKRPWSMIKDQVLRDYMSPYLAKVNRLRKPILLIDGYAGPGIFEDGKIGSPIIMCEAAERFAKGHYQAKFINKDKKHHERLYKELKQRGFLGPAEPLLGDSKVLLKQIHGSLKEQTVFLYLDPFGPTGCTYALLQPFLNRHSSFSTEIMLTLNMPGTHRLATFRAAMAGRQDEPLIKDYNQKLTDVFGGEYWKAIMLQDIDAEEREMQLIEAYRSKLASYLPFTRSCPVRACTDRRIKYFIVFASRARDALVLLNDFMVKAYFAGMHKADFAHGLWEDTDWREMRSIDGLDDIIVDLVKKNPGETRKSLWFHLVDQHFMRYLKSEYTDAIQLLIDNKKLTSPTSRKTRRLNENCTLFLPNT